METSNVTNGLVPVCLLQRVPELEAKNRKIWGQNEGRYSIPPREIGGRASQKGKLQAQPRRGLPGGRESWLGALPEQGLREGRCSLGPEHLWGELLNVGRVLECIKVYTSVHSVCTGTEFSSIPKQAAVSWSH